MENVDKEIQTLTNIRDNCTDENFKQVIDDVIKDKEKNKSEYIINDRVNQFIREFEEDFDVKLNKNKMDTTDTLVDLYNQYMQVSYSPTPIELQAQKLKNKLQKELESQLTEEQIIILREIDYCSSRLREDIVEQAFVYGYSMSSQMKQEAVNKYPRNNKTE